MLCRTFPSVATGGSQAQAIVYLASGHLLPNLCSPLALIEPSAVLDLARPRPSKLQINRPQRSHLHSSTARSSNSRSTFAGRTSHTARSGNPSDPVSPVHHCQSLVSRLSCHTHAAATAATVTGSQPARRPKPVSNANVQRSTPLEPQ